MPPITVNYAGQGWRAIMVVAVQGRGVPRADFIEKRFDLTPAQARLVSHLVAGVSLRSSAKALGIKYETVRTCLKSVFEKTGTHRQAELVLRVLQAINDPNPPAVTDSGGDGRVPSIRSYSEPCAGEGTHGKGRSEELAWI